MAEMSARDAAWVVHFILERRRWDRTRKQWEIDALKREEPENEFAIGMAEWDMWGIERQIRALSMAYNALWQKDGENHG